MRFFFFFCGVSSANDSLSTAMAASVAERLLVTSWSSVTGTTAAAPPIASVVTVAPEAAAAERTPTGVGAMRVLARLAGGHSTVALPGSQGGRNGAS